MKRLLAIALLICLLTACAPAQELPAVTPRVSVAMPIPRPRPDIDAPPPSVYDTADGGYWLSSAYPVRKGAPSYSLVLSYRQDEPSMVIPVLKGLPFPIAPEIREILFTEPGAWIQLSYREPFTGRENFELCRKTWKPAEDPRESPEDEQLVSVPMPDLGEMLFSHERAQPEGRNLTVWIAEHFGEPGADKQIRIGWRGPHAIEDGEDGVRCRAILYLLDTPAGVYVELETELLFQEGTWRLMGFTETSRIEGLGCSWNLGGGPGDAVRMGDDGYYSRSHGIDFPVLAQYPGVLIRKSDTTNDVAVENPRFHEDGHTLLWREWSESEDLQGPREEWRDRLGKPLYEDENTLLYPFERTTGYSVNGEEFCPAELAGYVAFLFERGQLEGAVEYLREEYSLTLSGFPGEECYCITVSQWPIGTSYYQDSLYLPQAPEYRYDQSFLFPLGRTAFLGPDGKVYNTAGELPGMDFAYGARDVNGDGYPEYFFTRVEEGRYGYQSYVLTRPNNGGYNSIQLECQYGLYQVITDQYQHWRALSKEELAGMRKVFERTPTE